MRVIIVSFYRLRFHTQIFVILLICVLYLPSLALRNLVLLFCCFALLYDLVLLLYCFVHLCLMGYGCHIQSFYFLVHLVQRVLYYEYLLISYINQSIYYLEYLECLKHFKHLKHPDYLK